MDPERSRRLQADAEKERRQRIREMTPGERMEEAFRLFRMAKRRP